MGDFSFLLSEPANNKVQAVKYGYSSGVFNLEPPTGGNYWSDFNTTEEGCTDYNRDGFCDVPYRFSDGVDYYPWRVKDGWRMPTIQDLIKTIQDMLASGVITNEGIANSLIAKLTNAQAAVEQGDIQAAKNMLEAFINQLEALSGKKLSAEAAAELIESAGKIIAGM